MYRYRLLELIDSILSESALTYGAEKSNLTKKFLNFKLVCGFQVHGQALLTICGCGFVIAAFTGNFFGYLNLIQVLSRLKFGIQFPSNEMSIIKCMGLVLS